MSDDEKERTLCCGICGAVHDTNRCSQLLIQDHVLDKVAPSKARLTLPDKLRLETLSDGSHTIEANAPIVKGTKFGPFDAKRVFSISPHIPFPLKIFACDEYFKEYYLDNSSEFVCNWMYFVKAANFLEEQNLICIQDDNELYYITTRDLLKGEKLYVWYGNHYSTLMDKGLLSSQITDIYGVGQGHEEKPINIDEIVRNQEDIAKRESWLCKFCGMEETSLPKFTEHILVHYKHKMQRCCELCKSSFSTKVALAKHIRLEHEPHQNSLSNLASPITIISKKILTLSPDTSMSNTADFAPGGPLLGLKSDEDTAVEDMFTATTSNMSTNSNSADNSGGDRTMAIDLDTEMEEADEYLASKFNFNVDDEGIVCDVCQKSFAKLRSLIIHLSKHTGIYCCKMCEKVFARKENLMNHGCQAVIAHSHPCTFTPNCKRSFRLVKQLNHHIKTIHKTTPTIHVSSNTEISATTTFTTLTSSPLSSTTHPDTSAIYTTSTVAKTFGVGVAGEGVGQMYKVCPRCNASFADAGEEAIHLCAQNLPSPITTVNKAANTQFECPECRKMFNKRASVTRHVRNIHRKNVSTSTASARNVTEITTANKTNTTSFMCSQCSKQFTNMRYLRDHQRSHGQKHVCKYCDKQFARLYTLKKHLNWHISFIPENLTCPTCYQSFDEDKLFQAHILEHSTNAIRPLPPLTSLSTNPSAISSQTTIDSNISDKTQTQTIQKNNIMIHFAGDTTTTLPAVNVTNMFKPNTNELIRITSNTAETPTKPVIRFISTIIAPRDALANIDSFGNKKSFRKPELMESVGEKAKDMQGGTIIDGAITNSVSANKQVLELNADSEKGSNVDVAVQIPVIPVVSSPNSTSTMIIPSPIAKPQSIQNTTIKNKIVCKEADCPEVFPSTRSMFHHYSAMHRRILCTVCKQRFPNNAALVTHQLDSSCLPGTMISCKHCDAKFKLKSSLARHVRNKHAHNIAAALISSGASSTIVTNRRNPPGNEGTSVIKARNKTVTTLQDNEESNAKKINGQNEYLSFLSETSASNTSIMSTLSSGNPSMETLLTHRATTDGGSSSLTDAPTSPVMDMSSSMRTIANAPCDGLDDLESNLDDIVNSYESVISGNRRSLMLNDADMVSANTTKSFYEDKHQNTPPNIDITSSGNDNSTSNDLDVDDYSIGDLVDTSPSIKRYKTKDRSTTIIRSSSSNNNNSQLRITESVLDFTSLEMDFQIQGISRMTRETVTLPTNSKATAEVGSLSMPELTDIEIEDRDITLVKNYEEN